MRYRVRARISPFSELSAQVVLSEIGTTTLPASRSRFSPTAASATCPQSPSGPHSTPWVYSRVSSQVLHRQRRRRKDICPYRKSYPAGEAILASDVGPLQTALAGEPGPVPAGHRPAADNAQEAGLQQHRPINIRGPPSIVLQCWGGTGDHQAGDRCRFRKCDSERDRLEGATQDVNAFVSKVMIFDKL